MTDNPFDEATQELPDFVQDTTPAPEAPEAQPMAEPQLYPNMQEQQPAATEEQAPPKSWAGKYTSPEELEKGYRELRELQRRTAERAKAYEQRSQEIEARSSQLENALRRAIPLIQQATLQQQAPRPPADPYAVEEPAQAAPPIDPRLIAQFAASQADRVVQERMQEYQAYQASQQAQAAEYQEAVGTFQAFLEAHPEVEAGGPADQDIAATITALNRAWEPTGSEVDLASTIALEIAYEASQRPALRSVLELNPQYIDTPEGMVLARKLASEIDGVTQQPGRAAPRPNTPVVERGSSQAPAPGTPLDEFDQAVAEFRKSKARGSDVFFGG